MNYLEALNQSSVTFVTDLGKYWAPTITGSGYEAITPCGEIVAFADYRSAQAFRIASVLEAVQA